MDYPDYIRSMRSILALLPLLLITLMGSAQIASSYIIGEPVLFGVRPLPGMSYYWKVMENNGLKKGIETNKVTWLSGKNNPEVKISWKIAGTYFVAILVSDENGCANSKVYPIMVLENHAPVAVDDYASSDWLKSIQIDLLKNDHDPGNDIDTSSLKILTNPQYGRIKTAQKGVVTYLPQGYQSVRDRFYYKICDLCNQCDSAMVSVDLKDPPLELPQIISPNGDGINDQFMIRGLSAYPHSELTIYGRGGEIIFHSDDYQNDWSGFQKKGVGNECLAPTGTCYYLFHPGGTARVIKGYIFIAR